jgi:hypothetical protein
MEAFGNYRSYDVLPIINSILPNVNNTKALRSLPACYWNSHCSKGSSNT